MKRKGQQTNVGNSEKVEISPNSGVNVKKKKFRFLSNNRLLKASQQEVSAAKASKDSKDLVESDSGDAKLTLCMDAKNAVPRGGSSTPISLSLRTWSLTGLGEKYANERIPYNHSLISVMSYNVLSDHLCRSHPELYKGKADDILNWETRFEGIVEEISVLNCQIVCLQEVDLQHFTSHFVPALSNLGYQGLYKKRTNEKTDGCAIFFKENELVLEHWEEVEYNQSLEGFLDRDNVGIVAKFRPLSVDPRDEQSFCVATTHLLYNPRRHDIKLAQLAILLAELDRLSFCGYMRKGNQPPEPAFYPCIVTGDLNLAPHTPIYKFLTEGNFHFDGKSKQLDHSSTGGRLGNFLLPPHLGITDHCKHLELKYNRHIDSTNRNSTRLHNSVRGNGAFFSQEIHSRFNELFGSGSLSHSFRFKSAYKPTQGNVGASAFQQGYLTVDYIFYSCVQNRFRRWMTAEGNLKLLSRLNLLPGPKITELGGLPCRYLPSDHICLAAKFLLGPKRF